MNAHLVCGAYIETVIEAGPLPERIEDMPAHIAKHYCLMRSHPGLNMFTDAEISAIMAIDDLGLIHASIRHELFS